MLLFCLLLCSVSALALGDRPECCAPLTNTTVRLPKSVVPHRYEILFTTDVADWKFSGEEQIIFEVVEDTNKIVFHSLDLNVESILVNIDGKVYNHSSEACFCEEDATVTLSFKETLKSNTTGKIDIKWNGILRDDLDGFYHSKYVNSKGEKSYMAVTQFETASARLAFPSFDEPAFKAVFRLAFFIPKDLSAISNMPVNSEIKQGDRKLVIFDSTPKMSSYLVAFAIGEFNVIEQDFGNGRKMQVITTVDKKPGDYALDVAAKIIPYYEEFLGVKYPLPKMDNLQVAEFSAGAMENWGLVTFANGILEAFNNSRPSIKRRAVSIIGHEFGHQWFGDIVTLGWWSHTWLNEGFATWMQYVAGNYLLPSDETWRNVDLVSFDRIMAADESRKSLALEVDLSQTKNLHICFGNSYSKGSMTLRMVHRWLGEEKMRKGLNHYLNLHLYDNAFTPDFWAAMDESLGNDINVRMIQAMGTFTKNRGHPVVRVSKKGDKIVLTHERNTPDGKQTDEDKKERWVIPIQYKVSSNPNKTELYFLTTDVGEISLGGNEWIVLNSEGSAFYRVNYDEAQLTSIGSAVKNQNLSTTARVRIYQDVVDQIKVGRKDRNQLYKFGKSQYRCKV